MKTLWGNANNTVKALILIIITMICCVLLLMITACIPQSMIQKQSEESALYFSTRDPFPTLIGEYVNSIQDNYSDTVLCDIIYCIDNGHPFKSVIRAAYAQGEYEEAYEGYLKVTRGETTANREYGRYWHGSMVLLRPLLVFMPILTIRIIYGALCVLIQLIVAFILFRCGKRPLAICSIMALILIEPHMLFTSLEYSNAFLVASVAELGVLILNRKGLRTIDTKSEVKKDRNHLYADTSPVFTEVLPAFGMIGVITCFADFLTTETLAFTLPMIILIAFYAGSEKQYDGTKSIGKGKAGSSGIEIKKGCALVLQGGIYWVCGFLGMFFLKIICLLIVEGKEVVASSMAEGFLRLGGEVRESNLSIAPVVDTFSRLSGAIWHNLACLYPVKMGKMVSISAYIPTILILLTGIVLVYLLHEKINWGKYVPLGMTALVPFVRFLVLSNHSYIHFFITYRALMVTIAVFLLFIYENGVRHLK